MADAEDLKSSGDFSSCGFDSHPGHHFLLNFQLLTMRLGFRVSLRVRLDFLDSPRSRP
jgi:hypothetical protein